jgi:hypothetical protein
VPRGSSCDETPLYDRDASNRCLPPNTLIQREPVLVCSRFIIIRSVTSARALDRLRLPRPRNRAVHAARNALVDRPGSVRSFLPDTKDQFCGFVERPTSDTPVALSTSPRASFVIALFRVLVRSTMLRKEPDRFHSEGRDAFEDFAVRGAFHRQAIRDSACPLRTPIVNRRQRRDFAHLASDCRLRFALRLTPVAFAPPRSFLW